MKIYAKKALISGEWMENCVVEVEDGVIRSCEHGCEGDLQADVLTPGLFDKHQHGGMGFDCGAPDEEKCREWLRMLLSHGVTNVLYTVSTGPVESTRAAIAFAAKIMAAQANGQMPGARVMGVHMEGPFLNPVRKGAMNDALFIAPTMENFEALTGDHADTVRAITIAPELPGALELAMELSRRGIRVQAGHTDADYSMMEKAKAAGFTGLTHTFNAMPGIGHRAPGPVVFGMVEDGVCLEAICDFVHLSGPVVKMLLRAKGASGVAMVSDSVTTAGMPDGEYFAGNHPVIVRDGRNYTRSGGIAGSYVQLDAGVKNVVGLGFGMEEAICAASVTPARYLGFGDILGEIAPGKRACLTAWNDRAEVAWGLDGYNIAHE